jgi:GNAT superfamily N-acetyltransferase
MNATRQRPRPLRQRILGATLRLLSRMGIRMNPFLVVEEAQRTIDESFETQSLTFAVASPDDIDQLLRLQAAHTEASLGQWFADGRLCFVAKDGDRIVALMWADLSSFNYLPNYRSLGPHEAYLFAAISDPEYRGHNVAPALRLFCYGTLRHRGISKFYSYSDYLNASARRFKSKLHARELELRLHVDLWHLWSHTFTLARYD